MARIAATLVALVLLGGGARRAEACGRSSSNGFVSAAAVYGVGISAYAAGYAVDLAFIVDDIRMAATHQHPTDSDAAVELAFALPKLLLGAALVYAAGPTCGGFDWIAGGLGLGYMAAATPLVIHGIWAAATREASTDPPPLAVRSRGVDVFLAPAAVSDGEHVGGGLAAVGRF